MTRAARSRRAAASGARLLGVLAASVAALAAAAAATPASTTAAAQATGARLAELNAALAAKADADVGRAPLIAAPAIDPAARAERAVACLRNKAQGLGFDAHLTDVVARLNATAGGHAGRTRSFLYVDVVKAASSSIRKVLARPPFKASWKDEGPKMVDGVAESCARGQRTKTSCWTAAQLEERFASVWSVVREPSAKFESGVRQMWAQQGHTMLSLPTADAALDALLDAFENGDGKNNRWWGNEHLQTAGWRLSGCTGEADGGVGGGGCDPIYNHLTMLGTAETLDADWFKLVGAAMPFGQRPPSLPHENARATGQSAPPKWNERGERLVSTLSAAGVRRLCASPLFQLDYECFGYPLPPECVNSTRL